MGSKLQIDRESLPFAKSRPHKKWHFDINWVKFEKIKVGRRFSNLPKRNPFQSSPVLSSHPLLALLCFVWVLLLFSRYCDILVNSMTIWSVLKLPEIAWPSPFNMCTNFSMIFYMFAKCRWKFPSTFLSIEDIDDTLLLLAKRRCKRSMEINIDILLLSVNPIRICKVFSQIFRVINLQKRNSFYSNAFFLVKVWSCGGLLTIPWNRMSKSALR